MTDLWTIGHGTRSLDAFVEALRAHRIEALADVRQFPASKRNPQFAQAPMRAGLEAAGIRYAHLVALGGYREGGYEAHMRTPEWRRGSAELEALAEGARTAIGCAETLFLRCHRRLVADHAAAQGWRVTHIVDAQRALPHRGPRQATLDETEGS